MIELREGRHASVGGLDIVRVLPTKGRRTVGPWCFVDLMLPPDATDPDPMEVGPHPHIGLSTVTWIMEGEAIHSDSLGTIQPIRPGQLNLMTAGHGIAHAELATSRTILGVQMWLAQPEDTRHGGRAFQHVPELPVFEQPGCTGSVLVGQFAGVTSPASVDSATVGVDLDLRKGATQFVADPGFEYCVVPVTGPVLVSGHRVDPGWVALVPEGTSDISIEAGNVGSRCMLLGGSPLGERIQMWWNFVARTRDELTEAFRDWERGNDDRFPGVPSTIPRIDAPRPPWLAPG